MHFFILLLLLSSCSGYRFSQQENPLSQYGITSLSVPMFYNYSNLGEVSADFTRETYRMLMNFSGLRLHSGYDKNSDAVMIAIIKSPDKLANTAASSSIVVAKEKVPDAVGSREKFSIPAATTMSLSINVIVIKKPTEEELALLKSGIGDKIKLTSRVIFNDTIPLNTTYTREILAKDGLDVNSTQNAGIQRKIVKNLAETAATSIRDMILYAF
jgi:hypothetical protein